MNQSEIQGVEIWRGGVTPWQCDEMGHMNVRFYLAIATEALTGLAAALGMPRAFSPGASSTLLVREHHVRWLKEARPGAALIMTGGVLSIEETSAVLLQVLHHASGEPAAAVTTRVSHVTPHAQKAFPWSQSTLRLARGLMLQAPDFALPRGVSGAPVQTMASDPAANALGLAITASGAVGARDCDVFGRMLPDQVLGRVHAAVSHTSRPSRQAAIAAAPELAGRLGAAAVEYRVLYHAWPQAGDRLQMRSGYRSLTPKAVDMVHWLMDPASGKPWATCEMVSLFLDLEARRSLIIPPAAFAAMSVDLVAGLAL